MGQARNARRSKGHSIVGPNGVRQSELGENLLECSPYRPFGRSPERNAGDEKPAESVGHRKRIAVALADSKLPLEVDAPEHVRRGRMRKRRREGRRLPFPPTRSYEPVALEDECERALRRQLDSLI